MRSKAWESGNSCGKCSALLFTIDRCGERSAVALLFTFLQVKVGPLSMLGSCLPLHSLHYSLCLQHLSGKPDEDPKIPVKTNLARLIKTHHISPLLLNAIHVEKLVRPFPTWQSLAEVPPKTATTLGAPQGCTDDAERGSRKNSAAPLFCLSIFHFHPLMGLVMTGAERQVSAALCCLRNYEHLMHFRPAGGPQSCVAEQPGHTILSQTCSKIM